MDRGGPGRPAIHRQLTEAALEWEANRRESSFLYAGTRLAVAREWAKTYQVELDAVLEADFLAASRRKRLKLRLALAALILVPIASIIGVWWSYRSLKRLQSDQLTHAVERDLVRADELDNGARWAEAVEVLKGALRGLEPGVEHDSLRRRVKDALDLYTKRESERQDQERKQRALERDREFVAALDKARLLGAARAKEGGYDQKAVIPGYQKVFHEYKVDIDPARAESTAEQIRAKFPKIGEARSGGARRLGVASRPTRRVGPFGHCSRSRPRFPAQRDPRRSGQEDAPLYGDWHISPTWPVNPSPRWIVWVTHS